MKYIAFPCLLCALLCMTACPESNNETNNQTNNTPNPADSTPDDTTDTMEDTTEDEQEDESVSQGCPEGVTRSLDVPLSLSQPYALELGPEPQNLQPVVEILGEGSVSFEAGEAVITSSNRGLEYLVGTGGTKESLIALPAEGELTATFRATQLGIDRSTIIVLTADTDSGEMKARLDLGVAGATFYGLQGADENAIPVTIAPDTAYTLALTFLDADQIKASLRTQDNTELAAFTLDAATQIYIPSLFVGDFETDEANDPSLFLEDFAFSGIATTVSAITAPGLFFNGAAYQEEDGDAAILSSYSLDSSSNYFSFFEVEGATGFFPSLDVSSPVYAHFVSATSSEGTQRIVIYSDLEADAVGPALKAIFGDDVDSVNVDLSAQAFTQENGAYVSPLSDCPVN